MEALEVFKRCSRCYGKGFYFKSNGYTQADKLTCTKCFGKGRVPTFPLKETLKAGPTEPWSKLKYSLEKPPKEERPSLYRKYGVEV